MCLQINSSVLAAFRRTTSVAATDFFCKKATSRLEANAQEMKSTLLTMAVTMTKSAALQGAARRFALTALTRSSCNGHGRAATPSSVVSYCAASAAPRLTNAGRGYCQDNAGVVCKRS
jgi:hypothetical protein